MKTYTKNISLTLQPKVVYVNITTKGVVKIKKT